MILMYFLYFMMNIVDGFEMRFFVERTLFNNYNLWRCRVDQNVLFASRKFKGEGKAIIFGPW